MFEYSVKVCHVGYFIVGEGCDGPKKYGQHFIPLSHEHTLPAFEEMGYEVYNSYVADPEVKFIQ